MAWTSLSQVFSPLSGSTIYDGLIWTGQVSYNYQLPTQNYINFSFDTSTAVALPDSQTVFEMNDNQKACVRGVLDYVHGVTGINFNETPAPVAGATLPPVDLFFGYSSDFNNGWYGVDDQNITYSQSASGAVVALDIHDTIMINANYDFLENPAPGTLGYEVLLHEIGHALGLKNGDEGPNALPAELDHPDLTIMASETVLDPGGNINYTQYNVIDRIALNWLYGGDGLLGTYGLTVNSSGTPIAGGLNPDKTTSLAQG
jgi:serralysin